MSYSSFLTEHKGRAVLVVVLHRSTVDRIIGADSAIIEGHVVTKLFERVGARTIPQQLAQLDVMLAFTETSEELQRIAGELKDPYELMLYLSRGWENRPGDEGDVKAYKVTERGIERGPDIVIRERKRN